MTDEPQSFRYLIMQKSPEPNGSGDFWCSIRDSNPGHPDSESGALPTELMERFSKQNRFQKIVLPKKICIAKIFGEKEEQAEK